MNKLSCYRADVNRLFVLLLLLLLIKTRYFNSGSILNEGSWTSNPFLFDYENLPCNGAPNMTKLCFWSVKFFEDVIIKMLLLADVV